MQVAEPGRVVVAVEQVEARARGCPRRLAPARTSRGRSRCGWWSGRRRPGGRRREPRAAAPRARRRRRAAGRRGRRRRRRSGGWSGPRRPASGRAASRRGRSGGRAARGPRRACRRRAGCSSSARGGPRGRPSRPASPSRGPAARSRCARTGRGRPGSRPGRATQSGIRCSVLTRKSWASVTSRRCTPEPLSQRGCDRPSASRKRYDVRGLCTSRSATHQAPASSALARSASTNTGSPSRTERRTTWSHDRLLRDVGDPYPERDARVRARVVRGGRAGTRRGAGPTAAARRVPCPGQPLSERPTSAADRLARLGVEVVHPLHVDERSRCRRPSARASGARTTPPSARPCRRRRAAPRHRRPWPPAWCPAVTTAWPGKVKCTMISEPSASVRLTVPLIRCCSSSPWRSEASSMSSLRTPSATVRPA